MYLQQIQSGVLLSQQEVDTGKYNHRIKEDDHSSSFRDVVHTSSRQNIKARSYIKLCEFSKD